MNQTVKHIDLREELNYLVRPRNRESISDEPKQVLKQFTRGINLAYLQQ